MLRGINLHRIYQFFRRQSEAWKGNGIRTSIMSLLTVPAYLDKSKEALGILLTSMYVDAKLAKVALLAQTILGCRREAEAPYSYLQAARTLKIETI